MRVSLLYSITKCYYKSINDSDFLEERKHTRSSGSVLVTFPWTYARNDINWQFNAYKSKSFDAPATADRNSISWHGDGGFIGIKTSVRSVLLRRSVHISGISQRARIEGEECRENSLSYKCSLQLKRVYHAFSSEPTGFFSKNSRLSFHTSRGPNVVRLIGQHRRMKSFLLGNDLNFAYTSDTCVSCIIVSPIRGILYLELMHALSV